MRSRFTNCQQTKWLRILEVFVFRQLTSISVGVALIYVLIFRVIMNNVVIFGSTGNIGLFCVRAALEAGLHVRAFLRDLLKLPEELKSRVEIFQGNVKNPEDVRKAVIGQDAVVVALGNRHDLRATTDLSEGMKNIIEAMKAEKVELVSVCLSAFLFYEPSKVPSIFKDITDDHRRMFDYLKTSGLKWITVFPGHFTDDVGGHYEVKHGSSPGRTITKHHLGTFLIESLSQPEHYHQMCGISTVL